MDEADDIKAAAVALVIQYSSSSVGPKTLSVEEGTPAGVVAVAVLAEAVTPTKKEGPPVLAKTLSPAVQVFLTDAALQDYGPGLVGLGVGEVDDLGSLEDADFTRLGMQTLEVKRLRRKLSEKQASVPAPAPAPAMAGDTMGMQTMMMQQQMMQMERDRQDRIERAERAERQERADRQAGLERVQASSGGAAGPVVAPQKKQMQVQCPPGGAPGQILSVVTPSGETVSCAIPHGVVPGQTFLFDIPDAVAVLEGFKTVWDARCSTKYAKVGVDGLVGIDSSKSDGACFMSTGATDLPMTGTFYFEVAFQFPDDTDSDRKRMAALGVWNGLVVNPGAYPYRITRNGNPFWGLRGDTDKDALRVHGKGKGKVGLNSRGLVIGGTDRIGALVNMDSCTMQFYRNGTEIPNGVVSGFPRNDLSIAAVVWGDTATLSFPGGPKVHHWAQ